MGRNESNQTKQHWKTVDLVEFNLSHSLEPVLFELDSLILSEYEKIHCFDVWGNVY